MKITKISSGQYKLSKEAWEEIGKKAGWHKKAQEDMIQLVALIDNDGKLINKGGYVIEGVGIFDAEDNAYPAGLNKLGELYASFVDQNNKFIAHLRRNFCKNKF